MLRQWKYSVALISYGCYPHPKDQRPRVRAPVLCPGPRDGRVVVRSPLLGRQDIQNRGPLTLR
jgi:hypothetical protein